MKITKAIRRLKEEYERAKGLAYVRDPVAFALYYVWKEADHETLRKMPCNEEGVGNKAAQNRCEDE